MKLVNRWLGLEIVFVQVGHGLLGAAAAGLIASEAPWWLSLALLPLVVFSLLFWLYEARFVMPAAGRLLRGEGASGHRHDDNRGKAT